MAVDELQKLQRKTQASAYLHVARVQRDMDRVVAQEVSKEDEIEVTPAHLHVLTVLVSAKRPMTARAIATEMSLSEVTVGRFLRALEDKGYVLRTTSPHDARAIHVTLSTKARDQLPRMIAISNHVLDAAFAGFTAAELQQFHSLVERMRENLMDAANRGLEELARMARPEVDDEPAVPPPIAPTHDWT